MIIIHCVPPEIVILIKDISVVCFCEDNTCVALYCIQEIPGLHCTTKSSN